MAKQTFTTGQVLTAAQMTSLQQTAMLGGSASAKTANYTLVAADAGTAITMSNAGATTITVNTGLFAAGDTVTILNVGAGTCTVTAGTATVSKPTNATLALVQNAGGVLYFTATGAATFLPFDAGAASTGYVGVSLTNSTNPSISSGVNTALTWDGEEWDTDNFHSTATNTSRITIPSGKAGKYQVTCFIDLDNSSTGKRTLTIGKNGASFKAIVVPGSTTYPGILISAVMNLIVGDYFEIYILQDSGSSQTVYLTGSNSHFSATYLGA